MLSLVLAFYLLVVLPAQQLWKSRHKGEASGKSRRWRYVKSIAAIILPLGALLAYALLSGLSAGSLGLDMPVSLPGQWGLVFAALLLAGLGIGSRMWENRLDDKKRADYLARIRSNETMPRTRAELQIFILLTLFLGIGWELLYRGFLLLALSPMVGTIGAVILSALAYGLAHGYKNPKQLAGSIISAFAFTIGFVLTGSLWWLMLVHVGLPLFGAISCYRTFNLEAVASEAALMSESRQNV